MKLIVTNLPWHFTGQDLENLFSNYCQVKNSRIIYDKLTGLSLGYGYVIIPNDKSNQAIQQLNGLKIKGNCITVMEHLN